MKLWLLNGCVDMYVDEIRWFLKGKIVYSPGTPDAALISQRNRKVLEMIEAEGEGPLVHSLIDHIHSYGEPELTPQPRTMSYYIDLNDKEVQDRLIAHPMLGWVISIATPGAALKMAGTVISQQKNYRWRSVADVDAALALLQEMDSTLPDLQAVWSEFSQNCL